MIKGRQRFGCNQKWGEWEGLYAPISCGDVAFRPLKSRGKPAPTNFQDFGNPQDTFDFGGFAATTEPFVLVDAMAEFAQCG